MSWLSGEHLALIVEGFLTTVVIVGLGFALGTLGGLLLAALKAAGPRPVRILTGVYIEVIRNTPFLIQASLLFALAGVARLRFDPALLGTVSVALYVAAYMAEILRGALRTVPPGQAEAARSLGLHRLAAFRLVVWPQLLPFALPAGANLLATVAKESAFLSALSVAELTFAGQVLISQTFRVFEVWAIIGALYLALILALLALAARLERSFRWAQPRTT